MDIFTYPTKEEVIKKARSALHEQIITRWGTPMLFLVSGGSAFSLLGDLDRHALGEFLTIGVLDERVDKRSDVNNFAQFMKTDVYPEALVTGVSFIDTRLRDGESEENLAGRFELGLQSWRKQNRDGFVLITEGMGSDGHTAGIMPYPEDEEFFRKQFKDEDHWVSGYDAKEKNEYPRRATVTIPFLENEVDVSIVLILGDEKREAFERVVASEGTDAETPARVMRRMKKVKIFTDLT